MTDNKTIDIELDTLGRPVGTVDAPLPFAKRLNNSRRKQRFLEYWFSLALFVGGFGLGGSFQWNRDLQAGLQDTAGRIVSATLMTTEIASYAAAVRDYTTPKEQVEIIESVRHGVLKLPLLTSSRGTWEAGFFGPDPQFVKELRIQMEIARKYQVPEVSKQ